MGSAHPSVYEWGIVVHSFYFFMSSVSRLFLSLVACFLLGFSFRDQTHFTLPHSLGLSFPPAPAYHFLPSPRPLSVLVSLCPGGFSSSWHSGISSQGPGMQHSCPPLPFLPSRPLPRNSLHSGPTSAARAGSQGGPAAHLACWCPVPPGRVQIQNHLKLVC